MIASQDAKNAPRIRIVPFFRLFDPGAIHTYRYIMFTLTSNGASMATNTFSVVDDKAVFHMFSFDKCEVEALKYVITAELDCDLGYTA